MADLPPPFVPSNARVLVRPRVHAAPGDTPLPLDQFIAPFVDGGRPALIHVCGGPGSGKSSALAYLRARFPGAAFEFHDTPLQPGDAIVPWPLIVVDAPTIRIHTSLQPDPSILLSFELASWTQDDFIEYLLANHPTRCRSVMARLADVADLDALEGIPELCTLALDAFAADESLRELATAFRRLLDATFAAPGEYARIAEVALDRFLTSGPLVDVRAHAQAPFPLLRHSYIRSLLAADSLVHQVESREPRLLRRHLPERLRRAAAPRLRASPTARAALIEALHRIPQQPTAVTLLCTLDPQWSPGNEPLAFLRDVNLPGVCWRGACMPRLEACNANFRGADFTGAILTGADFSGADLANATFENARLDGILLQRSSLTNTRFVRASLRSATFERARFPETDFSHADLGSAFCVACDFRGCTLDGASFQNARLPDSNFEGVSLIAPDFSAAFLSRSLFTGSRMPGVNFNGADLRNTGLADVDWPDADLRSANFHGATFHMGSSRSGLVCSPIASEGTRTGFYSDDYLDQTHKPPEEIRKANLCGADLRGAHVEDTDFYLVDLRDARYTEEQARHFANCGAILHTRTSR